MTNCPTCGRTYEDETMRFCLDDGSTLLAATQAARPAGQPEPTMRMPAPVTEPPPTIRITQPAVNLPGPASLASPQFSGAGNPGRGRSLLWLAIALIVGGSAIAVALILTRERQPDTASVSPPVNSSPSPSQSVSTTSPQVLPAPPKTANITQDKPAQATPLTKATPAPRPTTEKTSIEQPTPAPPNNAPRAPISGGVLNGKAVHLVQPPYPAIARSAHASGQVTVQVLIDEDGNVVAAHATSGHPLLQASAVAAARGSRFTPTKLNGQPVKVNGVIIYNFVAQ
jgi:TonB family protein